MFHFPQFDKTGNAIKLNAVHDLRFREPEYARCTIKVPPSEIQQGIYTGKRI